MKIKTYALWSGKTLGENGKNIQIKGYFPDKKSSDCAVSVLAGGAYMMRTPHSGEKYAEFLAENGITAFVTDYRIKPFEFPYPLLDSRRAIQFIRFHAKEFGIDKSKIAIMGTSAGGHLAALTSTYFKDIPTGCNDEISKEDFIPNAQILCYPVIYLNGEYSHKDSTENLLSEQKDNLAHRLTPLNLITDKTPPAFIWHSFSDSEVHVFNSIDYFKALKEKSILSELHIFPEGWHGIGLANDDPNDKIKAHVKEWNQLLLNWLKYIGF